MAKFRNNAITAAGRDLLALVHTGGELDPVSIVLGSGYIPAGKTAATMTEVVEPVITLDINKKEKTPDGKAILGGYYSNKDVAEDFYCRELALMARVRFVQEDGSYSYSDTVIYSYGNAEDTADLMAAYSGNTAIEKQMDIVVWIGNETAVNLVVEGGVYLTVNEFNNVINEIENNFNTIIYELDDRYEELYEDLKKRVEKLEERADGHDVELAALKANDVHIHGRVNEVAAQASSLWTASFSQLPFNPAVVDFEDLSGLSMSGGVWNMPLRRLEV